MLSETQVHFLEVMKEARLGHRKEMLGGAPADVMVVRKDSPDEVKNLAEYIFEQPYAGALLHPAVLPIVVVEDGLGEGEHLVQICFESYMCQEQGDGSHIQQPFTMVLQTSLAAFVAAAQYMVQEVGAGRVPDLPFGLDLWSQDRNG